MKKDQLQPHELLGLNPDVLNVHTLRELGFYLPGKEGIIPLGINPLEIANKEYQGFATQATTIAQINSKALAFALTNDSVLGLILPPNYPRLTSHIEQALNRHPDYIAMLEYIKSQPTLQRPDFLLTPNGAADPQRKLLEFNCTRPGGIYLSMLAASVMKEAGADKHTFAVPDIESLWCFFVTAIPYAHRHNARVALCFSQGYVGEIEMPRLANWLNKYSHSHGHAITFECLERDELTQKDDYVLDSHDNPYDLVYENAAPRKNGETYNFYASPDRNGTVVVNSPLLSLSDNKALLAVYFMPEFRSLLTADEIEVIEQSVPTTRLVRTQQEMLSHVIQHGVTRSVVKVTEGTRSSSGKGVYIGPDITGEHLLTILDDLAAGIPHIVMDKIPPEHPWISVHRLGESGQVQTGLNYIDIAPYVINTGDGQYKVLGTLSRARPQHPINVTQGGSLIVVGVKNDYAQ